MEWYEHLMGILGILCCTISLVFGIPAIAATRVGAMADNLMNSLRM